MIKAGTLCIVVNSTHGDHIGHIAMTVEDSKLRDVDVVRCADLTCRCHTLYSPASINFLECNCGMKGWLPEAWLKPLPPLEESEERTEAIEAI